MARPRYKRDSIDKDDFERCCYLMLSQQEVLDHFCISKEVLRAWCYEKYGKTFVEVRQKLITNSKRDLINTAYEVAMKDHNAPMIMFLMKNNCGYADNPNAKVEKIDVSVVENHNNKVNTITNMLKGDAPERDLSDYESEEENDNEE